MISIWWSILVLSPLQQLLSALEALPVFSRGYAIKKVVKVILVIVGLVFVAFVFLEYQKLITVNWNKIQTSTIAAFGNATSDQLLARRAFLAPIISPLQ